MKVNLHATESFLETSMFESGKEIWSSYVLARLPEKSWQLRSAFFPQTPNSQIPQIENLKPKTYAFEMHSPREIMFTTIIS
jgi:hypothetical protein